MRARFNRSVIAGIFLAGIGAALLAEGIVMRAGSGRVDEWFFHFDLVPSFIGTGVGALAAAWVLLRRRDST